MPSLGVEIRYGTAQHTKVLEAVLERFRKSKRKMEDLYTKFSDAEDQFQAYLPEKELDAKRKSLQENTGEPQYVTVVVPYSYAQIMTAHTYWTSVFLSRNPVFQFTGRHGEPQMQVQGVEALHDYQVTVGRMLVPLYCWLLDPAKYGFGVLGNYWEDEQKVISEIVEEPITIAGISTGRTRKKRKIRNIPGYQGNKIFNTSPRNFFPDPSVPLSRFQDGEFCGRTVQLGWNTLRKREESGEYFNLNVVQKMNEMADDRDADSGSAQINWPDVTESAETIDISDISMQTVLEMTVELIPRDWKLGTSTYPEKWVFSVANEKVIVGARPLGAYHNKYPFSLIEYEPEAYGFNNRSMLETIQPMGEAMTWLLNSHMYNVRQTLNNQFVGDPSRISFRDLRDPEPGFIARVKPAGYGQDVRTMLHQLPVSDVTGNHLRDMQVFERLAQQITGVNDNIMGMVNPGGRKTATEVRSSSSFGTNRLKTSSEYFSAMGFTELAAMMLSNTQQYYSQEKRFRIVGDLVEGGDPFAMITPDTIAGAYDFVPVDGTLPVDRFAQANLWRQIMGDMQKAPDLMAQFDMGRVMSYVAKLAGAKNFDQFRVDAQVQSDQQVNEEVQKGNLVPVKDVASDSYANAGEPGQIPGMGATA